MKNNWEAYYKGSIYFKYKKHLQIKKKKKKTDKRPELAVCSKAIKWLINIKSSASVITQHRLNGEVQTGKEETPGQYAVLVKVQGTGTQAASGNKSLKKFSGGNLIVFH